MAPETVRRRLKMLIEERGEDYASLSRMIGRNPSYIQQFITRGVPKRLREEDRLALARHFHVLESELGGPARPHIHSPKAVLEGDDPGDDFVMVPCHNSKVSADHKATNGSWQSAAALAFRAEWIRSITSSALSHLSVLVIDGDSMYPTLNHGDLVLVDAGAIRPLRDGIYVIRVDGGLQIRRIAVNPTTRKVNLKSDNPTYTSWEECPSEAVDFVGRVVWVGRRL